MADGLEEVLDRIRRDVLLDRANEESIKQTVVLPIFRHLGWDIENRDEVHPEFPVEGKRADYCLKHNQRELVLIEAKRPGELTKDDEEQLFRYVFRQGVPIGVLTNGLEWRLYFALLQGAWNGKIFKIDITEQELLSACQHFRDLLGKDSVIAGRAPERAKALLGEPVRVSKTNEALPMAWLGLWKQPDDLPDEFFEAISQRVESLCGYQTKREQVVEFITQNRPELASLKLPATKSVDNIARHRDEATKRERVLEILQDGNWHSAPELRKKLETQAINAVLYKLEEEGTADVMRSKKGSQVRLRIEQTHSVS